MPAPSIARFCLLTSIHALAGLSLSGPGFGQESPSTRFTAEFHQLKELVEICSVVKRRPILWEKGLIQGEVRIQPGLDLNDEELWRLTIDSLAMHGFAVVQGPEAEALRVVATDQAAKLARLELNGLEESHAGFLKVLIPLENLSGEQGKAAVQHVLSGKGSEVQMLGKSGRLLLADFKPQLEQALGLLARLDAPSVEVDLLEVQLANADATSLAALLGQIGAKEQSIASKQYVGELLPLLATNSLLVIAPADELQRWHLRIERFDREQPLVTEHYSPTRFGLEETALLIEEVVHGTDGVFAKDTWKLVRDRLTGTLLVTTTPAKQLEVARLLARLESTAIGSRRPMKAYPIKNRQVVEVLELLQGLVDEGVLESEGPEPTPPEHRQGATAPLGNPKAKQWTGDPSVLLTADEGTNRLIAIGSARQLDQLGPLIEDLDVAEAQVLVEAMVVNLTESQMRDLGVELAAVGNQNGVDYGLGSLFGLGAPDPTGATLGPPSGQGLVGSVLDPGRFSAVLRALETVNEGRTLSMPRMLVNNNQEASLDSVLEAPYTSTNASDTVATTSFGGSSEAGTQIDIKPQIAAGDRVVIDYSITLSGFTADSADANLPPPKQGTSMKSVVTVPDGFTVILGGIEQESETEGESHVPFLGSIPLLGEFFKSRSTTKTKSRFFVFLRCNVLRSESFADLKYLSTKPLEQAGLDQGIPRLKPRVIR